MYGAVWFPISPVDNTFLLLACSHLSLCQAFYHKSSDAPLVTHVFVTGESLRFWTRKMSNFSKSQKFWLRDKLVRSVHCLVQL